MSARRLTPVAARQHGVLLDAEPRGAAPCADGLMPPAIDAAVQHHVQRPSLRGLCPWPVADASSRPTHRCHAGLETGDSCHPTKRPISHQYQACRSVVCARTAPTPQSLAQARPPRATQQATAPAARLSFLTVLG